MQSVSNKNLTPLTDDKMFLVLFLAILNISSFFSILGGYDFYGNLKVHRQTVLELGVHLIQSSTFLSKWSPGHSALGLTSLLQIFIAGHVNRIYISRYATSYFKLLNRQIYAILKSNIFSFCDLYMFGLVICWTNIFDCNGNDLLFEMFRCLPKFR